MPPELLLGLVLLVALVTYSLSGGADFGGGVWDLFSRGPRARAQRETIVHAIAPIWEANHVWLILIVVVLFVCFPVAFAAIFTTLHIPMTVLLVGIVLRGSAFVFRSYGGGGEGDERRWSRVFAISSVISPIMLGICLGALGTSETRLVEGRIATDFVRSWLAPFPIAVGIMTLSAFAYLAAVYLTLETDDDDVRDDFRLRALVAALAFFGTAWIALLLARTSAPAIFAQLLTGRPAIAFHTITGLSGIAAVVALLQRRFRFARAFAIVQVGTVIVGWAFAQYPYLLRPDITLQSAKGPDNVLWATLGILAAGGPFLLVAFAALYRLFKGRAR